MNILKKLYRGLSPNPLDQLIKQAVKKKYTRFLLAWNRGLGDIPLGLYAVKKRILDNIPDAQITFLTREDLKEGFDLLGDVEVITTDWKRDNPYHILETLKKHNMKSKKFDVIIKWPDPTYWVKWQIGNLTPRLKWQNSFDELYKKYDLQEDQKYLGVQPLAETNHGIYRNWSTERCEELFCKLKEKNTKVLLFGYKKEPYFNYDNIIDLRGETTLLDLLSIIKNKCFGLVLPDSGILSIVYYLDVDFPLNLISLWADPNQGVLKQNVSSPNKSLKHTFFVGKNKNLQNVEVENILKVLFEDAR